MHNHSHDPKEFRNLSVPSAFCLEKAETACDYVWKNLFFKNSVVWGSGNKISPKTPANKGCGDFTPAETLLSLEWRESDINCYFEHLHNA